jgi:hypothetical protein
MTFDESVNYKHPALAIALCLMTLLQNDERIFACVVAVEKLLDIAIVTSENLPKKQRMGLYALDGFFQQILERSDDELRMRRKRDKKKTQKFFQRQRYTFHQRRRRESEPRQTLNESWFVQKYGCYPSMPEVSCEICRENILEIRETVEMCDLLTERVRSWEIKKMIENVMKEFLESLQHWWTLPENVGYKMMYECRKRTT